MLPYIEVANRTIPTYGICMAIGILLASYVAIVRTKKANADVNSLIIIAACAIGFGLLGAKLLYIITSYGIERALKDIIAGDFGFISEGGQVFYGGLIAGAGGACLGALIAREKLSVYCDIIVPCVPLGHVFGRLGCFFAGCCYGVPYDGVCSVKFPAAGVFYGVFPVQLLEAIINIGIFFYLIWFVKKRAGNFKVLFCYIRVYSISRFLLEFLRGDAVRGFANGLSTSQWISIALFVLSLIPFVINSRKSKA